MKTTFSNKTVFRVLGFVMRYFVYVSLFILHTSLGDATEADEYDSSKPLFLTPLISAGRVQDAQDRAAVQPFLPNITSYSGYITVDRKHRSHIFFWFFPQTSANWTAAPLIVFLNGGPGASSMNALFNDNGPYTYNNRNGRLEYRKHSWTNDFNVLYIDNPVGTGFSFTESADGYARDQTQIGENLHEALVQFLLLFPQLNETQLVLSGVSYAGKYLTSLVNTISRKRSAINVFGVFLGNPLISFEHMLPRYNEFLYTYGLLDADGRETLRQRENEILTLIYSKNWANAGRLLEATFFEGTMNGTATLLQQLTGLHNHYNVLRDWRKVAHIERFLTQPDTRRALHVGDYVFGANARNVEEALLRDLTRSCKRNFEQALEQHRVLVFTGQFDIICAYYLNEKLFNGLSWSGAASYRQNTRYQLRAGETLVGYYKQARNFTHVLIRDAGHQAIGDQPVWLLGLLKKFVTGTFDQYIPSLDIEEQGGERIHKKAPNFRGNVV